MYKLPSLLTLLIAKLHLQLVIDYKNLWILIVLINNKFLKVMKVMDVALDNDFF